MTTDMDKDIVKGSGLTVEEVSRPGINLEWEEERKLHEAQMFRQTALEFAINTEQISTIGAGDTSEAIRKRIVANADEYVTYIMNGSVENV